MHAADRGDTPPAPVRRYRQLQKRIKQLKRDYRRGRRPLRAYWKAVAHAVHAF